MVGTSNKSVPEMAIEWIMRFSKNEKYGWIEI
jgi:hypothetical protein